MISDDESSSEEDSPQREDNNGSDGKNHDEIIASISSAPKFNSFKVRGVLQGHQIVVLIDSGATHNFIDASLVNKRQIPLEDFEGFSVMVADGRKIACTQWIPQLSIMMGNHTVTYDFYVVDLGDIHAILGVQWLQSLGKYSQNFQTMELKFRDADGRRVVLRGMASKAPKIVSARRMESIFRHDDIVWAAECDHS